MSGPSRSHGGGLETRVTQLEELARKLRPMIGIVAGMGSVDLNNNGTATSTTKTDASVTASSIVLPVGASAGAWSIDAGIVGITASAGSFTVSHTASTLTRTFNYIVINPL